MTTKTLDATVYNLTQNLQGALFQAAFKQYFANMSDDEKAARPAPPPIMTLRGGYAESPAWVMVQMAEFAPEPLTVDSFRVRAVYSAPRLVMGLLELLASEGWLDREGEHYTLTDAAQPILQRMADNRVKPFRDFAPVPHGEALRLESLLRCVLDASLASDDPPGTWCLAHSRNRALPDDAPPLAKIASYGADFNAYRDDAHMAAYTAHDVDGQTWEAFSFVRDGNATDADSLFAQLAYRGWTRGEWAVALSRLADRGWLASDGSGYQVTDAGRATSATVEAATDRYFFAPWETLTPSEQGELVDGMNALMDRCTALVNAG